MVEQYCWQYVSKDEVYLGGQGFSTLSTCPLNLQVLLNGTDFFNNHLWNWEKKKIKDKENDKPYFMTWREELNVLSQSPSATLLLPITGWHRDKKIMFILHFVAFT